MDRYDHLSSMEKLKTCFDDIHTMKIIGPVYISCKGKPLDNVKLENVPTPGQISLCWRVGNSYQGYGSGIYISSHNYYECYEMLWREVVKRWGKNGFPDLVVSNEELNPLKKLIANRLDVLRKAC